ncbi:MAG: TlpA family protein disulfide reductase [Flavobacteriales bacterium]
MTRHNLKTLLLVAVMMAANTLHAQKGKIKIQPTMVSGLVMPTPQKGYFLLQHHGQADTVRVATDGTFKLQVEQTEANYYTVIIGKQMLPVYLLPLDNFSMTLNSNLPASNPQFEGSSAPYCYYLAMQKANSQEGAMMRMSQLKAENFIAECDSLRLLQLTALEKENAKHKFISPFVESERKAIDYGIAYQNLIYMYQNEQQGQTTFPEAISKSALQSSIEDETMRYHDAFITYASNCINYKTNKKYDLAGAQSYAKYSELKVEEVCSLKSQVVRDVLFQTVMQQIMQDAGSNDIRPAIAKFETCSTDEKLKQKVKQIMSQYIALYPGEMAPDAVCFDTTGHTMRLSDHRGKVLYIDTWATWCGPCKREIPELKKLETEYHGQNVEFISISTDQNLGAWKTFLSKQEMTGMQMHQSENFEESISKLYMVNSIPRFIVIDEKGKIVSADAPRPSSGNQVRDMLNNVLAD